MQTLIIILASINLLLSYLGLARLHQPTTLVRWGIKVFICALSPVLFLLGLLTAIFGWVSGSELAIVISSTSLVLYFIYIVRTTRAPDLSTGFEKVFGKQWKSRIPLERQSHFLARRYVLRLPNPIEPVFLQNISFHTIADTNRQLVCDIWQPPKNIDSSGVAFIYLHGSAWTVLDKDFGTRTFFRHLANQGHVIMDVAYRLFPEAGILGMVHDAKHAIAWMKANAARYGVNPERIVIGGGSAGAHIALLAAYSESNMNLTPTDLAATNLRVHAVISLYGQADLTATYYHTCQHLGIHSALARKKEADSGGMPSWMQKSMGEDFHRLGFEKNAEPGMLVPILGGTPEEKPDAYALFSPLTHAKKGCPATQLIHGEHDILAPLKPIHQLRTRLDDEGVPVVMHVIPLTDHAFDLIFPRISPSAHNCYYDVERFLALMV